MKVRKGQWVDVRWRDAVSPQDVGWVSPEQACKAAKLIKVRTMGLVLKAGKRRLVIAQSQAGSDISQTVAIPVAWIEKVRVIE